MPRATPTPKRKPSKTKPSQRKKKPDQKPTAEPTSFSGSMPPWAPDQQQLERLPPEIRQALSQTMQPLYEQYVLHAPDPLEQSVGITLVHLLWMELLEQFDLKNNNEKLLTLRLPGNREAYINQHLRVMAAKTRLGHFLMQFRRMRKQWEQSCKPQDRCPPPMT